MLDKPAYNIYFSEEGTLPILKEQSILDAALSAGIHHYHICGGNVKCSTCRVLILNGAEHLSNPSEKEKDLKNKMNFPPNVRLACQTKLTGEPVTLQRIIRGKTDITIYISSDNSSSQQIGNEEVLSIFFLYIRNFTGFVETHLAFDVIHIVRKLFLAAQTLIESFGGKIIETISDGFYAVCGCENSKQASVQGAIHAKFDILKNLEELNEHYFKPHFNQKFEIGIGVHFRNV